MLNVYHQLTQAGEAHDGVERDRLAGEGEIVVFDLRRNVPPNGPFDPGTSGPTDARVAAAERRDAGENPAGTGIIDAVFEVPHSQAALAVEQHAIPGKAKAGGSSPEPVGLGRYRPNVAAAGHGARWR